MHSPYQPSTSSGFSDTIPEFLMVSFAAMRKAARLAAKSAREAAAKARPAPRTTSLMQLVFPEGRQSLDPAEVARRNIKRAREKAARKARQSMRRKR